MNEQENANIMDSSALQSQLGMSNMQTQQQLLMQEQERGLAEEQLDVEDIIQRIHNLLLGKEYKDLGDGNYQWIDPKDNSVRILSDWGIQRFMQIVRFHINKNTLLSNFAIEDINRMMFDITTELNDLVLLKYQQLFREATFEECRKIIEHKLAEKQKTKEWAREVLGLKVDKEQIRKDLILEMEFRIEKEIDKVRSEKLKEKIKEYGMLLWEVEFQIYSSLNRALGGKERETLRRHAQFTEVRALSPESQKKGGMLSWLQPKV